jgi:hypothetical protein
LQVLGAAALLVTKNNFVVSRRLQRYLVGRIRI